MKTWLLSLSVIAAIPAGAQISNEIFATTGKGPKDMFWAQIQPFNKQDAMVDAYTLMHGKASQNLTPAQATPLQGIAALAYDGLHNRLYFAPMFEQGRLIYIDLDKRDGGGTQMQQVSPATTVLQRNREGEAANITRMTIGDNRIGYALTNDAQQLYSFNTKTNEVQQLGPLRDHPENGISVHEACSSWGGDMVASDEGKLYLFTMYQQVYEIDPGQMVAKHLGKLQGLSADFKINGAAVTADNEIVLSNATISGLSARITKLSTLEATMQNDPSIVHASDLASRFVVKTRTKTEFASLNERDDVQGSFTVTPNPVANNTMTITFGNVPPGAYVIDLINTGGTTALRHNAQIAAPGQTVTIRTQSLARGMYVVKVVDRQAMELSSRKVVIQ